MKRNLFILTFLLLSFFLRGNCQQPVKEYEIKEVSVVRSRNDYFSTDHHSTILDSSIIHDYQSENIDKLLSTVSPVYIVSYGTSGAVATSRLRGTTGNHTSVTWNGFPLNSITLGQADLSFAPAQFIDKVKITHGASGSLYGSGTFGGNIDLKNNAEWKRENNLSIFTEYGSWESKKVGFKGGIGNNKFKYKIKGLYHDAVNDYEFVDYQKFGNPAEKRKNNELLNYGLMQNLYWKLNKRNKFEAGLWYQVKEKNIPEIMGVYGEGTARQKDSTLRGYLQYTRLQGQSSIKIKTGYFKDFQLYTEKNNPTDDSYSIYSPINADRWISNLNYRNYVNHHLTLDIGGQYSLLKANGNAYDKEVIKEYRASITGALQFKYNRITSNVSLRQQFNTFTNPKPQVSVGLNYKLIPDLLALKGNFSTKYRLPTFNDKYWQPGGNKNIKPEHGYSGESGLIFKVHPNNLIHLFSIESTAYTSRIKNLIQWIPSGSGYWESTNQEDVQSYGFENSVKFILKTGSFQANISGNYNYSRSYNISDNKHIDNKQLMYIPYNTVSSYGNFQYRSYSLGVNWSYTSKRFNTNDHQDYMLDPYHIFNLQVSKRFHFKHFKPKIQFKIKNLFDHEYQVVKNYPMPGRAYYINISIQIENLN